MDVWISPEQLVTEYVARLIRYPGALQVLDFADGRVRLVGIRALQGGPLVGQALRTLREHIPTADARVAAIYRAGKSVKPEGDTVIEDGDEVFFLAARKDIRVVMKEMRREEAPARRVVIAGGGNIGVRLASELEDKNQVKLIERDGKRARRVSEQLKSTTVLHGDAADEELLLEENIDSADVFAALTNSEEANILSAMLAKRLGAHKVMALINKPSYAELIESGSIDVAISPQTVTIGSLLAHVRRGDVVRVHSLRRGAAEALEVVVHGDADSSKVIGRRIEDITLPEGTTLGRGGARRGRHHRASRHHRAARRSFDPVPDGSPPYRSRRKTLSRLRLLSCERHFTAGRARLRPRHDGVRGDHAGAADHGGLGARSGALVLRHFRAGDFRARRAAVARHPALQARAQDPRRPDAGRADLGRAAGGGRLSAVAFTCPSISPMPISRRPRA